MLLWGFITEKYRRWRTYHQTVNELSRLDDRSLADLNITRGDIDLVARRTARGT
jgi:uncharacterized protein YjiS (DUF1127 family)